MLTVGLTATATTTVTEGDLAIAVRSGDVPVFATPVLVALCEEATVAAVAGSLEPGRTTVGVRVDVEHLAPSVVGATVVATATLDEVDGRRLRFAVRVEDGGRTVARGSIHRVVVDRDRFVAGLSRG